MDLVSPPYFVFKVVGLWKNPFMQGRDLKQVQAGTPRGTVVTSFRMPHVWMDPFGFLLLNGFVHTYWDKFTSTCALRRQHGSR